MVTWQIINILSLRLDHTSERFTASTSIRIMLLMITVFHLVAAPRGAVRASRRKSDSCEDPFATRPARTGAADRWPRGAAHPSWNEEETLSSLPVRLIGGAIQIPRSRV